MKLMKKDIKPNEMVTTFFALEYMRLRISKNQKHFLELALQDKSGKIEGYLWNDPIMTSHNIKEKSYIKVKGTTSLINGSLIINVEKIRAANKDEIDINDFLEVAPGGLALWKTKLYEQVNLIRDTNCKRLINSFLNDKRFMELFLTSPAGISVHHNYIGGLLEHTVNTMSQAVLTADNNRGPIDKDLLLTGSFLHDSGKIREMLWDITKEYTTEGKLLGHIGIGLIMIDMSKIVMDALLDQKQKNGMGELVFCNKKGKPFDHNNITKRVWYPTLKKIGLPIRNPYQTRHTAATLWLASGENPEWVARQLGHSTTEMLFRVYSKFIPNLTRRDGSAFERLFTDRLEEFNNNGEEES